MILIPLDGTDVAEQVLPYVVGLAGLFDSRVTLVQPTTLAGGLRLPGARAAYLEEQARRLRSQWLVVDTAQLEGDPTRAIIQRAREIDADLIALPGPQQAGGGNDALSDVADALAREAPCPVLLVPVAEPSGSAAATISGGALWQHPSGISA